MFNWFRYKNHPEAAIVSCFFNPQKSPYRTKAFAKFYDTIKHLNHHIVECVIENNNPELKKSKNISHVYTSSWLWHKESLLNLAISNLDDRYKYVFWVDADVLFDDMNWLYNSVRLFETQDIRILQPFEYCIHLEKDQKKPSFDPKKIESVINTKIPNRRMWRSFCSNYQNGLYQDRDYNIHGHVGFAWGATREVLRKVPLYDKGLIGGADHIIAHAAAGQIPHSCIDRSFTDDLDNVYEWSRRFYEAVDGKIGYVPGYLYHIWHGDISKRRYLERIKEFTPITKTITDKDVNGLYKSENTEYVKEYFSNREVKSEDNFFSSLMFGYLTNNSIVGWLLGGNFMGGLVGEKLNTSENNDQDSTNSNFS